MFETVLSIDDNIAKFFKWGSFTDTRQSKYSILSVCFYKQLVWIKLTRLCLHIYRFIKFSLKSGVKTKMLLNCGRLIESAISFFKSYLLDVLCWCQTEQLIAAVQASD
jgi:hypothetical protein